MLDFAKFDNKDAIVYELKRFDTDTAFHPTILFFKKKDHIARDFKFRVIHHPHKSFVTIRTPIFIIEKNNSEFSIGTPKHFIRFVGLNWIKRIKH